MTSRRAARGQSLPGYEVEYITGLEGYHLYLRARELYQSGWTLRSIGEAFNPPRTRSTVRYWVTAQTPIASAFSDHPLPPVPRLVTPTPAPLTPRRHLTVAEHDEVAELAPIARKYRATMHPDHKAALANVTLTALCRALHHGERVTIRELADAAGVSYRAMARRVS